MTEQRSDFAGRDEHWPAAVVFDLDGTLVDSVGDIASSINDLMTARQLAPFTTPVVRGFVGDGIDALVERALRARDVVFNGDELREAIRSYEKIYASRLTETTRPYDGVLDVIAALRARGARIGVCTNKVEDKAVAVVEGLGLCQHIDVVRGARSGRPQKPSPVPLLDTLAALGVTPAQAVMVGDSAADVKCARAAETAVIGVSFGYTPIPMRDLVPDVTIDHYAEFEAACAWLRTRRK